MAITRRPWTDDDGSGTTGSIINNAWLVQMYDDIDAAIVAGSVPANWLNVPYNAADFTSSAGGWTVDAADMLFFRHVQTGHVAHVQFFLNNTSLSAASVDLMIKLPYTGILQSFHPIICVVSGTSDMGIGEASGNRIRIIRDMAGLITWPASANNLVITGSFTIGLP